MVCGGGDKQLSTDITDDILNGINLESDECICLLEIKDLDNQHISAENLWVSTEDDFHTSLISKVFSKTTTSVTCLLPGTDLILENYRDFESDLQGEKELATNGLSKLSAWYPERPRKIGIQMDQYPPAAERHSSEYREAKNSFPNRSQYITVHGYGVIQEAEYVCQFRVS
ncbi:hypothetical protein GJ744_000368 [Endocarpon pusillum]|uniref:Uncharacterized protein n=1 Tax=Endocarpon pusillum TaxID=364733 RepID=A0A8H7EAK6_9EURO|nr:hypothetical protein GJ744_000368 [Endocarpon pusillum]